MKGALRLQPESPEQKEELGCENRQMDSRPEARTQGWMQFAQPTARSARRYHQVDHLRQCGNRAILEALLAVEAGQSIDAVLTDFSRLPPELYEQTLKLYAAYQIGGVA
jgi:hypothetical protein